MTKIDMTTTMPSAELKEHFYTALKKEVKDLSEIEIKALINRIGFLSDTERDKFKSVLIRANLSKDEEIRYINLGLYNRYFPEVQN
jgi:hypothetical protein